MHGYWQAQAVHSRLLCRRLRCALPVQVFVSVRSFRGGHQRVFREHAIECQTAPKSKSPLLCNYGSYKCVYFIHVSLPGKPPQGTPAGDAAAAFASLET